MSYRGKITTTGSSEAIRLDKELFKQNPEFRQQAEVRADIIGPGKMLISVVDHVESHDVDDPIAAAFLAFIQNDLQKNPHKLDRLDKETYDHAAQLTSGVDYSDQDFQ